MEKQIEESELILNKDGSVFHLHLKPEHISENIILVGDPGRVQVVSYFFDRIEYKIANREFITYTGIFNNKRITVVSTGIGTDNIDIVVNELDALVNVDLKTRTIKSRHTSLNFIRIGTSGSLQKDVPVDSYLISKKVIGFDGLLNFYANRNRINDEIFEDTFVKYMNWDKHLPSPYIVSASEKLFSKIVDKSFNTGITISAPGFYGPQGRVIRLPLVNNSLNNKLESFSYQNEKITNFEMESSAIYGLSKLLGHHAVTVCAIIANRVTKEYSKDYKPVVKKLIELILKRLTN